MVLAYEEDASEETVRKDFDYLATAYAEAACDAFGEIGGRTTSERFRERCEALGSGARRREEGTGVVGERRRDARGFRVISRMEWFRSQHEDGVSDCLTHETRV